MQTRREWYHKPASVFLIKGETQKNGRRELGDLTGLRFFFQNNEREIKIVKTNSYIWAVFPYDPLPADICLVPRIQCYYDIFVLVRWRSG
jgi:hypothetical protein